MIAGYENGVIGSDKALQELVTQMLKKEGRFAGLDLKEHLNTLIATLMNGETVGYAAVVAARRNNADPEKTGISPDDAHLIEALNAPIREALDILGRSLNIDPSPIKDEERRKGVPDRETLIELVEDVEDRVVNDPARLQRESDGEHTEDVEEIAERVFRNELMQFLTLGYAKELSGLGSDAPVHILAVKASKEGVRVAATCGWLGHEGGSDA